MADVSPPQRPSHHATANPILGVVVAVGAYEVVADIVNDMFDAALLPSFRNAIDRFSWRTVRRKVVPRWSAQGAVIVAGIALGAAARARARSRSGSTAAVR